MATILVIDDDAPLARLYRFMLREEGHIVLEAPEGRSALDELARTPVDLIILDLEMPGMNGRSFFREIVGRAKRPPVLIVSAFEAAKAQRELGAEGAVDKPFDIERLVEEVRLLLPRAET